MGLFDELKRRNVFRVGIAYVIAAWVLLQITDVVGQILELPVWGGKLILLILVVGFPLSLIFAWAFEMTPEGVKREKDVDRSHSIANQTGRKLDRMIIGILTVAVAYLLLDKLVLQEKMPQPPAESSVAQSQQASVETSSLSPVESGPSVAVLPFVNMSSDPEQEYFSDGLTETLLHMLAQLSDLRVAARTSSFAFKGKDAGIRDIGKALGVAHILEGSVQKSGDRVRVTAQLVRANDGFHVWSQSYTRPLEDIFAIQDEIATDVASALDASLLGGDIHMHNVETDNLTAYDLYLKAMEQQAIFSYGSLVLAETYFKQALAADPAFIDAKLGLIRNFMLMSDTGRLTREAARKAVTPLLEQVKTTQPDNRQVFALELVLQTWEDGFFIDSDRREAVYRELRNLLPLMPSDTFLRRTVALFLANFHQQYQAALQVVEAGLMVDPLSPELYSVRGRVYTSMNDYDAAEIAFQRAIELEPDNPNHYGRLSNLAALRGDLPQRLNWMRRAAKVDPQDHELAFQLAEDFYDLKLAEEGDRWANRVYALAPNAAIARKLKVTAAVSRTDYEEALRLARANIEDRIDSRRGAFGEAVSTYAALMIMQNRARDAYEFLISEEPSIADFSVLAEGPHAGPMQGVAGALKYEFAPPEEMLADWEAAVIALNTAGIPWQSYEYNRLFDALVRRDFDAAAAILLGEIWNKPVADFIARSSDLENTAYRVLLSRPDVAARKAERDEEFKQVRDDVQRLLLSPEWNE